MKFTLWFFLCVPFYSHADFLLQVGGFYESATDTAGSNAATTTTRMPLDVHAAYLSKEWIFGATYDNEDKTTSGGGTSYKETRTALGPTIGYTSRKEMGFYGLATYFLSADYKSGDTSYSGSGFQVELGYRIMFKHAGLGVQGAYRSFTYKQTDNHDNHLSQTRIDPGVFLVIEI